MSDRYPLMGEVRPGAKVECVTRRNALGAEVHKDLTLYKTYRVIQAFPYDALPGRAGMIQVRDDRGHAWLYPGRLFRPLEPDYE